MRQQDEEPAPSRGERADRHLVPAWRRHTEGETIAGCCIAVVAVSLLHLFLNDSLSLGPRWLMPAIAAGMLVILIGLHRHRMHAQSAKGRVVAIALLGLLAFFNIAAGIRLVSQIIGRKQGSADPIHLIMSGASIWITNVVVFGLFYWSFDRGGPAARAQGTRQFTDFMFPQMSDPTTAPSGWEPTLVDYEYLAFTNATAFSPTDVMPLTRPAKMAMMVQSALSLVLIGLVLARAVNILAT
jgi:uncharacterized membrane protein